MTRSTYAAWIAANLAFVIMLASLSAEAREARPIGMVVAQAWWTAAGQGDAQQTSQQTRPSSPNRPPRRRR
jgi:hypothetical protein